MADSGSTSPSPPPDDIDIQVPLAKLDIYSNAPMPILSNECDGEVDGEDGDCFPFLDLPDELISHTFSFLSIEDRMRARVNKRLNKIELESHHYVRKLEIREFASPSTWLNPKLAKAQSIEFIPGRSYSADCIRRLTQTVSIGVLRITLTGSSDFHREVYNLIKDFDIRILEFARSNTHLEEIMDDSLFLDLKRASKVLNLSDVHNNVSPDALHEAYKMMKDGAPKEVNDGWSKIELRTTKEQCLAFLGLIGITFRNRKFFSSRNIEAIARIADKHNLWSILHWARLFDGNLEIYLVYSMSSPLLGDRYCVFHDIELELHGTSESLAKAKRRKGFRRVDVAPE